MYRVFNNLLVVLLLETEGISQEKGEKKNRGSLIS